MLHDVILEMSTAGNALSLIFTTETLHHRPDNVQRYPNQPFERNELDSALLEHVLLAQCGLLTAFDCIAVIVPSTNWIDIRTRSGIPMEDSFLTGIRDATLQALRFLGLRGRFVEMNR